MKKILFLLVILFSLFSCEDGTLIKIEEPEPTDIFRCKVNGVEWKPAGEFVSFGDPNPDAYYYNYLLGLRVRKETNDVSQFMSMTISTINSDLGIHPMGVGNVYIDFNHISGCINYYSDTTAENIIDIIKIDSVNNIIEGSFKFVGVAPNCLDDTDTVRVTDGYFNIKYRN